MYSLHQWSTLKLTGELIWSPTDVKLEALCNAETVQTLKNLGGKQVAYCVVRWTWDFAGQKQKSPLWIFKLLQRAQVLLPRMHYSENVDAFRGECEWYHPYLPPVCSWRGWSILPSSSCLLYPSSPSSEQFIWTPHSHHCMLPHVRAEGKGSTDHRWTVQDLSYLIISNICDFKREQYISKVVELTSPVIQWRRALMHMAFVFH